MKAADLLPDVSSKVQATTELSADSRGLYCAAMSCPRAVLALAGASALLVPLLVGCDGRPAPIPPTWSPPDSVASAFARPSAVLARAGASRSFQVRPDGSLYNGAWCVELRPFADGVDADAPHRIAYEDRWCPIVRWRRASSNLAWEFEAVSFPAAGDTVLIVSLAVRATNLGIEPADVRLEAGVRPPPDDAGWLALDTPPAGTPLPGWTDVPAGVVGLAIAAAPGATPTWSVTLAPGKSRDWRLLLGSYPLPRGVFAAAARRSHARRLADTRAEWQRVAACGMQLALGDPEVENAWRAANIVLLQNRVRRDGHWLPRGNPLQYQDTWLRDGARAIAALAVAGYSREARELASGLTAFQWRSGAFLSQRGQLDGHGQALWAFAQASLRPAADSTVARFASIASTGVTWLRAQRERGAASGLPYGAMLPFGEPRDGELVRAQLVGNDAWAIAGLESAGRLLRAAGRITEAVTAESLRTACLADFAIALARTGRVDLPPSWQGPGHDWGNLAVAWPCRALPPGDPHCAALARRVWNSAGGDGLASYGASDSLHGYVGADLGTWALLADRPADALRVLDALLRWRDATGGSAELFSRSHRDYGTNWPPHSTGAAALVHLTRNLLIEDDGDTLLLTAAPRETWWSGARVRGAPTRWGTLDLQFARHGAIATWRWTPVHAWTALRLPAGTILARRAAPPLRGVPGDRTVFAPPGTGSAEALLTDSPVARERRLP